MSKFSPGPWHLISNSFDTSTVYDVENNRVAQCRILDDEDENSFEHYQEIMDANSRLIAAAPELLEALQNLSAQVGGLEAFETTVRAAIGNTNYACVFEAVARARAAIKKAIGE